jgi:heptosyltransferase-2
MTYPNFLRNLLPQKIIVRMPNWLGDMVMATPILTDLRLHWPAVKITVLCQSTLSPLLQEDPRIDHLLTFNRPRGWFSRIFHKEVVQLLQKNQYDVGILLPNSFSSAWWFWLGNVHNRIGYATHWRSCLLDHTIHFSAQQESEHLVAKYKQLLGPLGIPLSTSSPSLFLSEKELTDTNHLLTEYGINASDIVIGVHPGAAYGSAKCWPPAYFQELIHRLLDFPQLKILFLGDKGSVPLIQTICSGCPERVVNLSGKTSLRQLMALIKRSQLFLTNDSGPMHVASALHTPLIALFGSTNEITTGPYNGGVVIHKHVACSPCYRRECPIDFRCMKNITVDEVYREAVRLLSYSTKKKVI